jgi:dTDP-4-dehydrorhamnose reductase
MRILITGASGLLGLNLALEASGESTHGQHRVFGVTNSQTIRTDAFTVIPCNLLAPMAVERLLEQTQPDWVIHCAALANLDACEHDPALASELNTEVPRKLAQHVSKGGARLVHISTDSVFDGQRGNYTEEDLPNPPGVYSRTKLGAERAVAEEDPTAIIARVTLFGWSVTGKRSLAEFFFNNLSAGKQAMGFTDVFFCPLLANDLAHLLMKMLEKRLSGLYHVVSSENLSKYAFGLRIARRFGFDEGLIKPVSVEDGGLTAKRSPNLSLCTDKLTQALGEPPPDVDSGIEKFYQQYQSGYAQKIKDMIWKSE